MNDLDQRTKQQIALLAGDDLEGESAAAIRGRVESCPHCRGHWVRVRGCLDVLEQIAKAEEPAGSVWPALRTRLRPIATPRRDERFNGWIPAFSMTAACAAILSVAYLESGSSRDLGDAWPTTQAAWPDGADGLSSRVGFDEQWPQPPVRPRLMPLPPAEPEDPSSGYERLQMFPVPRYLESAE